MGENTWRWHSRRQLLRLLQKQEEENQRLRWELENREIAIERSGSLAEAALRINGLFEATQAACEQYTRNVRRRCARMEQEARECSNRAEYR